MAVVESGPQDKNTPSDTADNSNKGRLTITEHEEMIKTLRHYFNRGLTNVTKIHELTGYDPKTITKYFNIWHNEIENSESKEFIKRERRNRTMAKIRYEYLLFEEFAKLEDINNDIKEARKAKSPELPQYLNLHSNTIKSIASLNEKMTSQNIQPTASETLGKIVEEKVKKYNEHHKANKRQ